MRAIAAIGGEPSLGVSANGNLNATWQDGERSLTLEGLPAGLYKWALVVERADDFICLGGEADSLGNVRKALAA
jgi:hypothetical protein